MRCNLECEINVGINKAVGSGIAKVEFPAHICCDRTKVPRRPAHCLFPELEKIQLLDNVTMKLPNKTKAAAWRCSYLSLHQRHQTTLRCALPL